VSEIPAKIRERGTSFHTPLVIVGDQISWRYTHSICWRNKIKWELKTSQWKWSVL